MYLGRIVEVGTTEQILAEPQHPYTKALLSVVPESGQMEQQILTGEAPDPSHIPTGCRFHPRCPVFQSGEAEQMGIFDACMSDDPVLRDGVACHAAHR
jgi:peptide/nickel transport system ATP-binding protein